MGAGARLEGAVAACSGLTTLFFSDGYEDAERAIEICHGCVLRLRCLEAATARREPAGVWGGHVFRDGRLLDEPPKRGRPAKAA